MCLFPFLSDEVQKMNLKLQEQKMESKAALFELQQEMAGVITDLGFEKTVLLNEKASLQNEVSFCIVICFGWMIKKKKKKTRVWFFIRAYLF